MTINAIGSNKPIEVAFGGTGLATLTAHRVQAGNGTASVTQLTAGSNGNLLLGVTSSDPVWATPTSTGGSITYTTGAASLNMDAINYVTGTFVPVLSFGGASVGITYTTRTGNYARIGNLLFIQLQIVLSSKGTSVGACSIGGLPVSANATPSQLNIRQQNLTYTSQQVIVSTNASALLIQKIVSAGGVNTLVNTEFVDTSEFIISGIYFA